MFIKAKVCMKVLLFMKAKDVNEWKKNYDKMFMTKKMLMKQEFLNFKAIL